MYKIFFIVLIAIISLYAKSYAIHNNQVRITQPTTSTDFSYNVIKDSTNQYSSNTIRIDSSHIAVVPINQESIEEYKADEDFNYKEALPEDNWWTRFKQKINDLYAKFIQWLTGGGEAVGIWAVIIEILPYLLLAGIVALIIWLFLKIDSGSLLMENIKAPETLLSDDEALIQRPDLQKLLDESIANGDYRIAIRFYYLITLQKMSAQDVIDWQVQKTNHDYLLEIKDKTIRTQFIKLTDIYDYIWYGSFNVDEIAFAKAESSFKSLNETL